MPVPLSVILIFLIVSNSALSISKSIFTTVAFASNPFHTYSAIARSGVYLFNIFLMPADVISTVCEFMTIYF